MEEALLEQARRAAVGGDPSAALELTARHARQFPRSQLAEEREFIAVQALLRAGRRDEARGRGAALLRRAPRGIFADAVRRLLGGTP